MLRNFPRRRWSHSHALKACYSNIRKHSKVNTFVQLIDEDITVSYAQVSDARDPLTEIDGWTIAVKDNICCVEGYTTASSAMLRTHRAGYDAWVVKVLRDAGGIIIGKTNMDEFGMGSGGVYCDKGPVVLPGERIAGGSSSGSAAAVKLGMASVALGTDTGGSVRLPASYCGIVGYKPSYGAFSRHGLVAYASSMDCPAILASSVKQVNKVAKILLHAPKDIQDPTHAPQHIKHTRPTDLKALTIGVPVDFNVSQLSPLARSVWEETLSRLEALGVSIKPVSMPSIAHALPVYYIIAMAEASSNLSRYTGLTYVAADDGVQPPDIGLHEYFTKVRDSGFGDEVTRRILTGTFVLSSKSHQSYFEKAQKIRRKISDEFTQVFDTEAGVDLLITPTAIGPSPTVTDFLNTPPAYVLYLMFEINDIYSDNYVDDVMTVPASLAGLPAVSIPSPTDESMGIQLIGARHTDEYLLEITETIDTLLRGQHTK